MKHEEHNIQVQIVGWLRANLCRSAIFFAVPNGGSRATKVGKNGKTFSLEAVRMKKEGVTSGVADIMVLSQDGPPIGLEVKTQRGRQSKNQKWWQGELEAVGGKYFIVRSVDDVVSAMKEVGLIKSGLIDDNINAIDEFLLGNSDALPIDEPLK